MTHHLIKWATGYLPPAPPADPGWVYTSYIYGDSAHKHAVTGLTSGETYQYDANGNMTQRVENGATYTQVFDGENRLESVTVNGQTTTFVYDGDGNLVKKVKPDGTATVYVGGIYEVELNAGGTASHTTKYYGSAMRVDSTLYYVLGDHLGSASVVLDTSGNVVAEQRYYPYGETRLVTGTMMTDRLFTGQREITGLGIYHFGARFYSPTLARFVSADSVVPEPVSPQALDRYTYANNNPINYTDPTGHGGCYDTGVEIGSGISQADCWAYGRDKWMVGLPVDATKAGEGYSTARAIAKFVGEFGYGAGGTATFQVPTSFTPNINFTGWSDDLKRIALEGAYAVATALQALMAPFRTGTPTEIFNSVFSETVEVIVNSTLAAGDCLWEYHKLGCNTIGGIGGRLFAHELGHVLNWELGGAPYAEFAHGYIGVKGRQLAGAFNGGYLRTFYGMCNTCIFDADIKVAEDFADMFSSWAYGLLLKDAAGAARYSWMETHLSTWVQLKVQLEKTK